MINQFNGKKIQMFLLLITMDIPMLDMEHSDHNLISSNQIISSQEISLPSQENEYFSHLIFIDIIKDH